MQVFIWSKIRRRGENWSSPSLMPWLCNGRSLTPSAPTGADEPTDASLLLLPNQTKQRVAVGIAGGCTYNWVPVVNSRVEGGTVLASANDLAPCQSACIRDYYCTGINWVGGGAAGQRCRLLGPGAGQRITAAGVTYYGLTRNCPSQSSIRLFAFVYLLQYRTQNAE